MCGICGVIYPAGQSVDEQVLLAMRDVMTTRGPDSAGLYLSENVGLGHRRLAVIDLSDSGHQPMVDERHNNRVVFNGEIYNFKSLKAQLVESDYHFKSDSDTEVLLAGYACWGMDGLLKRLRGMFAFALWDASRQSLLVARDHLGKKPLFYQQDNGSLLFSSDLKSIWLHNNQSLELNAEAVDELFYYYFISQRRTIYNNVKKLAPGHWMEFRAETLTIHQYWQPNYRANGKPSVDDWVDQIDVRFREAVRRRMISDVPVGAFLSGGIDSSLVCAVMAEESSSKIKTFTAGYGTPSPLDERIHAAEVADIIGSEHIELEINPDVANELTNIVWHYGEPFGDSSAVPSYLIAKAAREQVTVVLTGDGGDEGFAGYDRYLSAANTQKYDRIPKFIRGPLAKAGLDIATAIMPLNRQLRRFQNLQRYVAHEPDAHARFNCIWDGMRHSLLGKELQTAVADFHPVTDQHKLFDRIKHKSFVDQALEYVLVERLPSDYLTKVDVATMAHSLEARSPFLDVDLLELAFTIPSEVLLTGGRTKSLLKTYLSRFVPESVVNRKKAGFEIPISDWFRTTWYESTYALLTQGVAVSEGYLQRAPIAQLLSRHRSGENLGNQLWTLLVFEIWLRLFVTKTLQPGDEILEVAAA